MKKISSGKVPVSTPSIASRVITQWEQDKSFFTKAGKPKVLQYGEIDSEFNSLVFHISKDLHPASVLFELERLGVVEKTPLGLSLLGHHHVAIKDIETGFSLLSCDISDLLSIKEKNLLSVNSVNYLHTKTVYDNIYHEDLDVIKQWLLTEGAKFHNKIRNYLARFDKDIKVQKHKTPGAEVTFCTFANTEEKQQ